MVASETDFALRLISLAVFAQLHMATRSIWGLAREWRDAVTEARAAARTLDRQAGAELDLLVSQCAGTGKRWRSAEFGSAGQHYFKEALKEAGCCEAPQMDEQEFKESLLFLRQLNGSDARSSPEAGGGHGLVWGTAAT
ncbi:hypothetical protein T484DRAFT_1834357, partial [Baffinella frigidus]